MCAGLSIAEPLMHRFTPQQTTRLPCQRAQVHRAGLVLGTQAGTNDTGKICRRQTHPVGMGHEQRVGMQFATTLQHAARVIVRRSWWSFGELLAALQPATATLEPVFEGL